MRTLLLLAGTHAEMRPINGGDVSGLHFNKFDPLYVCEEYSGNIEGVSIPGVLPSVGKSYLTLFGTPQVLTEEFAEQLMSTLDAALARDASQNPDVAAARKSATCITRDGLEAWIDANRGKWIARAWVG